MTLLEIRILMHYYCFTSDYKSGDFTASAVRAAIDRFRDELGLLEGMEGGDAAYELTERGRVFVEALRELPLPKQVWVMEK